MNQDIGILVVDGNPDQLGATCRLITGAGYRVLQAVDGESCLQMARDHSPELVLLNELLPDINGIDVAQQIKASPQFVDTFVVLISHVNDTAQSRVERPESDADGHITRPISDRELISQLDAYVRVRQAEKNLRDCEGLLRTSLQSLDEAFIATDATGVIQRLNPKAEELSGWPASEAVGRSVGDVFSVVDGPCGQPLAGSVINALRQGTTVRLGDNTLLTARDGVEIFISAVITPILTPPQMQTSGVVLVFRDETEARRSRRSTDLRLSLIEYAKSHTLAQLLTRSLDEVGRLVDSPIGFYHFVESDQKTLALQQWSTRTLAEFCQAEGAGLHYPVDQAGVWVDCVHQKKAIIHNDYASLPHKKGIPEGHPDIIRELVVPVMRNGKVVAILGVGNKPVDYTEHDLDLVSFLADVTWEIVRKKREEERLAESERSFRSTLDGLSINVAVLDEQGNILLVNKAWRDFVQQNDANAKADNVFDGDNFFDFCRWSSGETAQEARDMGEGVQSVLSSQKSYYTQEYSCHVNGRKRWFLVRVTPFSDDGPRRVVVTHEEISERKLAEQALRQSRNTLRALMEAIPQSVMLIDPEGIVLAINTETKRRLQMEGVDLVGQNVYEYVPPEVAQRRWQYMEQAIRSGELVQFDDTRFGLHVDNYIQPIRDENGVVTQLAILGVDITERKRMAAALQQAHDELEQRVAERTSDLVIANELLMAEITHRRQVELALKQSRDELRLKQQLAQVLLTAPDDNVYADLLDIILDEFDSPFGYFGYIDLNGDLLCPSMTRDIWDKCQISGKDIRFPRSSWGGLWGQSLLEKRALYSNSNLQVPAKHVALQRALVVPILLNGELIGQIALANKAVDYSPEDVDNLKRTADYLAPILKIRLERDGKEEERQRAEAFLRESEEKYRVLFETVPMGITISDKAGNVLEASPFAERLLGVPKAEHEQRGLTGPEWRIVRPDGTPMPDEEYASVRALKENQVVENIEMGIARGEDDITWLNVTAAPIPLENYGVVVAYGDITANVVATEALRQYEHMVAASPDSLSVVDKNYVYRIVNDEYLRRTLKQRSEIVGHHLADVMGADVFEAVVKAELDRCFKGEMVRYQAWFDFAGSGRRYLDVTYTPYRGGTDVIIGAVVGARDITQLKNAENALRESEQRYRLLFENMAQGAFYQLADGQIIDCNSAVLEMFGLTFDQFMGRSSLDPHWKVVREDGSDMPGEQHPSMVALLSGRPVHDAITGVFNPVREDFVWLTINAIPQFRPGEDKPYQVFVTLHDITELKRAKEERERLLAAEQEQRLLAETLREVTLSLTSQTDTEAVLAEILHQSRRLVPYHSANIALLHEERLVVARWEGYPGGFMANSAQPLVNFPLEAEAVRARQPVVVKDTLEEPRWVRLEHTKWIRSYMSLPILQHDRVLGLLRLDSATPGRFSTKDATRLWPLAHSAAIALENSRLYEQAKADAETRAVLLQEVNHRVKNNLAALTGMLYIEQRHAQQTDGKRDPGAVFDDLINRIKGLSKVHQMLSASNWSPLSLADLTRQITSSALQALPTDRHVATVVSCEAALMTAPKEAHNLALIINDLTTNVIKYATRPGETTHLNIYIDQTEDKKEIIMEFRDDGPGFPDTILQSESAGRQVGLYLIENTVRHSLRGSITLHNDNGAVVTIQFAKEME